MTHFTGTSKAPRRECAPGDVIGGKYGLVRLLGEGGMGSVWVAENLALKANVALKLIRADVAEASANERFLSEARLAARLQHAAIVRVFDFGKTEQDEPYIVMELLEGETLGQRLARLGAIDAVELIQTLLPIIDALHSAHGHGVIHRDLKPDNVFIAKADGGGVQPKLLDFGIAKLRGEGAFHSTKLTQAGTLIGSPDYMSPEQARGETDLDPRSDVWALCVLAYECLVGKPPFHGDNYNALLWAIIHDDPVPVTVFQAGDSELWRILKIGFAKDRGVRWDSARKLGEAFAVWLESHGVTEDACNRSLQASWLPGERPTRPELTPFDPVAGPPRRSGSGGSLIPPPTLAAIRRPHTMSLWFAGLGLITLLGALFFSRHPEALPVFTAERGASLAPSGSALEAPEFEVPALDVPAPDVPPGSALGLGSGTHAPEGAAQAAPELVGDALAESPNQKSSWRAPGEPESNGEAPEVAGNTRESGAEGGALAGGVSEALSPRAIDFRRARSEREATAEARAEAGRAATAPKARRTEPKASAASRARARPARPAPRKPEPKPAPLEPLLLDSEVDFGI